MRIYCKHSLLIFTQYSFTLLSFYDSSTYCLLQKEIGIPLLRDAPHKKNFPLQRTLIHLSVPIYLKTVYTPLHKTPTENICSWNSSYYISLLYTRKSWKHYILFSRHYGPPQKILFIYYPSLLSFYAFILQNSLLLSWDEPCFTFIAPFLQQNILTFTEKIPLAFTIKKLHSPFTGNGVSSL